MLQIIICLIFYFHICLLVEILCVWYYFNPQEYTTLKTIDMTYSKKFDIALVVDSADWAHFELSPLTKHSYYTLLLSLQIFIYFFLKRFRF